jgi:hypothetical protein
VAPTAVVACCSSTERLDVLLGMSARQWWLWVMANCRVRSEMSESKKKFDGSDYHVRERCAAKKLDDVLPWW